MSLPKLTTPTYEMKLISNDTKVTFRPFLVGEQKILMMAYESGDNKQIIRALLEILKACIISPKDLDLEDMPLFDLEYAFLQLRSKSVGEAAFLMAKCKHCGYEENRVRVDTDKMDITRHKDHETNIPLTNNIGVVMRYPNASDAAEWRTEENVENVFDVITSCIKSVYDNDTVYDMSSQSKAEVEEFINSLNTEQFGKLQKFFDTMPKVSKKISYKCKECKKDNELVLEGINSFFS